MPAAKKSVLEGRIKKELNKRPREASSVERRKPEKKVRLFEERSPEVGRVKASLHSSASKKEDMGAPAMGEGFSQLGEEAIVTMEEPRVEEDSEKVAEIPYPLVVKIVNNPDEAPSEVQGEPAIEGPPSEGLRSGDVGPTVTEAREEFHAGELPPEEVGGAGEQIEASVEPAEEEQVLMIEEEPLDEEKLQDEDLPVKASPTEAPGTLARGLAEVFDESQARLLLKEARRLKASQLEVARTGSSDGQPSSSDPAIEAAFSALMKSALHPSASPGHTKQ